MIKAIKLTFTTKLSFRQARVMERMLTTLAGGSYCIEPGSMIHIAKRDTPSRQIRGNIYHNKEIHAITKNSLSNVKNPILQEVIRVIVKHNEDIQGG